MTIEEILKAIEEKKIDPKTLAGKLKDKDGAKEVFDNYAKVQIERQLPAKLDEAKKALLGEVAKATGVKFEDGDDVAKLAAKAKEHLGKNSDASEREKELQAEIEKLKDSDKLAKHLKEEKEQLEKAYKEKLQAKEEEIKAKVTEMTNTRKASIIDSQFASLESNRNPNIPEAMFKEWLQSKKAQYLANSDFDENGKLFYKNDKGEKIRNENVEYADIAYILKNGESTKDFFGGDNNGGGASDKVTQTPNGGQGTGKVSGKYSIVGEKTNDADKRRVKLGVEAFNTRVEFNKEFSQAMKELGVAQNSQDWITLEKAAFEDYKFNDLPSGM